MTGDLISAAIDVDAPPAAVFAILADPRQHARIDGSGSVREVRGPERLEKGAEFGADMRLFGMPYRITHRVVEFTPDRQIAWRHFAGHRWRYELEPLPGGGTRVTETFDYSRYKPWAVAIIRVLGFPKRNRAGIEATLPRLKAAAEADATSSSA